MLGLFGGGQGTLLLTLTSAVSALVTLGFEITFVVVALTVVKKHRPDASTLLAIAPGINICGTLFTAVAYPLGLRLVGYGSGVDSITTFYAAMHMGSTLVYAISALCMLLGLIKLAKPPREANAAYATYVSPGGNPS